MVVEGTDPTVFFDGYRKAADEPFAGRWRIIMISSMPKI
jgi:hypothetical protein